MFNWLRINGKKKPGLEDWNINQIDGFKKIQNDDSTQFVNEEAGKLIYFSIMTVSGGNLFDVSNNRDPTIKEDDNGWQLKGFKSYKNKILVCVINVKSWNDVEWATEFFNSIAPRKISN